MRRDVVRVAICVLGVSIAAGLPLATAAASPLIEIHMGRACGTTPYCVGTPTLTVPAGSTVVWRNLADVPLLISRCTAATCPGQGPGTGADPGPQSPAIGVGAEFVQAFRQPGTYHYSGVVGGLALLSGTVTVTAPAHVVPVAAAPPASAPNLPITAAPPPAPAAAAAPQKVGTPVTGAEPPWAMGLLLVAAGTVLLAVGRRARRAPRAG